MEIHRSKLVKFWAKSQHTQNKLTCLVNRNEQILKVCKDAFWKFKKHIICIAHCARRFLTTTIESRTNEHPCNNHQHGHGQAKILIFLALPAGLCNNL